MKTPRSPHQLAQFAIDFHCHGIGPYDFTEIHELSLETIEALLAARQRQAILTIYLPEPNFQHFLDLMKTFA